MMTRQAPFRFLVQIWIILSTWNCLPRGVVILQLPLLQQAEFGISCCQAFPTGDVHWCSAPPTFLEYGLQVLPTLHLSAWTDASPERSISSNRCLPHSCGHGSTAPMQTRQTHCRFLVQVGSAPSLYCRRSSNVYELLLLCPHILFSFICELVRVMKVLLMSDDVE